MGRPPDPAHLIPKQRLRSKGIEEVWDKRAIVPACRHHHHMFDHGFLRLLEYQYPACFIDYATEHGLYWDDERRGWFVGYRARAT